MLSTDVAIDKKDLELQLDLDLDWIGKYSDIHSSAVASAHNTVS